MRTILLGPTCVGKTSLSIALAGKLNAEIISVDSRQCYKHMNIGTASPSPDQLSSVKHYNISMFDPDTKDSAADFCNRAHDWEDEIIQRGRSPLYVGGSTLYLQCIITPFDNLPPANMKNIEKLEHEMNDKGVKSLYDKLSEVDPAYAKKMDGLNTQRIIRALDIWMQTGRPFSSFHSDNREIIPEDGTVVFGVRRARKRLYQRINARVESMINDGFLEEVQKLRKMGFTLADPGLNTVGYREAIKYLDHECTLEQLKDEIKTKTRHYAKRQLTWFRRWEFIQWIDLDSNSKDEAVDLIVRNVAAKSNKV